MSQVWSVSRPNDFISASAQRTAAPIPRFGSVCEESVCRVPKLTSFSTSCFICCAADPQRNVVKQTSGVGDGRDSRCGGSQQQAGKQAKFTHTTSPLSASATGI